VSGGWAGVGGGRGSIERGGREGGGGREGEGGLSP
jgi:hypothetical protein